MLSYLRLLSLKYAGADFEMTKSPGLDLRNVSYISSSGFQKWLDGSRNYCVVHSLLLNCNTRLQLLESPEVKERITSVLKWLDEKGFIRSQNNKSTLSTSYKAHYCLILCLNLCINKKEMLTTSRVFINA